MSMNEKQNVTYNCIKAGKAVLISLEYYSLKDFRELVGFACKSWQGCGVGKEERPGSWVPNWSKCEHPQCPKSQS